MPTRISKERFDAFLFGLRGSGQTENWTDVAHWEAHDGRALAVLLYVENDKTDAFMGALFLRNKYNRFCAFPPTCPIHDETRGRAVDPGEIDGNRTANR